MVLGGPRLQRLVLNGRIEEEGWAKGVRTSSGQRKSQILNLNQYVFVVLGFLDVDYGVP